MTAAGIISEYNPLHCGHVLLFQEIRRRLGQDCGIVCIMSGDFVQRGDFAVIGKRARAAAAVKSGADLVLELPLPWAVASAEEFAFGAVYALAASGVVDWLAFGSECGDAKPLDGLAAALLDDRFPELLREELRIGDSFAAARQRAAAKLSPDAGLLESPNNILGVEYCKSLRRLGSSVRPLAFPRRGCRHDCLDCRSGLPSASAIRLLLREGRREQALDWMAPAMADAFRAEEAAGRAPVFQDACERAVLARLRSMDRADFAALDQGHEGLGNRLWQARGEPSLERVLERAKTKRYPLARLRRMILWAYLGVLPGEWDHPLYLRPLAANQNGRRLLARMRSAELPVLTRAAQIRKLSDSAQRLFSLETRAADLFALAYPQLSASPAGGEWRAGPVML